MKEPRKAGKARRTWFAFALAPIIGLAVMTSARSQVGEVLDRAGLLKLVSDTAAAASNVDPFAKPAAQPSAAGRKFRLEFPVTSKAEGGRIWWSYDVNAENMTFSASMEPWDAPLTASLALSNPQVYQNYRYVTGFPFVRSLVRNDMGPMSNAYGATVPVQEQKLALLSVAAFSADRALVPEKYEFSMKVLPEDGRRLSTTTLFIVEGELLPLTSTSVVTCGFQFSAPSFRAPVRSELRHCALNARFTRLFFWDKSNNRVLQEWTPGPAAGTSDHP